MLSDKVKNVILEELCLQEDEEFEVRSLTTIVIDGILPYRINGNGLECFFNGVWNYSTHLDDLLLGEIKIVKLPFIPKKHEEYYSPDILAESLYKTSVNHHVEFDIYRIDPKLCFRTKEDAIVRAKEILKLIEEED